MELKMKQPEFRKKSLFERVIGNIADTISDLIDNEPQPQLRQPPQQLHQHIDLLCPNWLLTPLYIFPN